MPNHVLAAFAASLLACSANAGTSPPSSEETPTQASASTASSTTKPATVTVPNACASGPKGTDVKSQACYRWRCEGDPAKDATWDGDSVSCKPGNLDPDAATRALARINLHRELAGLEPFAQETPWDVAGQACALIAQANEKLSHTPDAAWKCFTDLGGAISEDSLVANRSAPPSIAAYFEDPANEATMVHRRWLLDETLGSIGIGSTEHYSCIVVNGDIVSKATSLLTQKRGWAAWPPAGAVPIDVFEDEKLDVSGWTLQSTTSELDSADVSVTVDGVAAPVTVTHLTPLLGSRSALRFVPQGWVTEAGRSYTVHVSGSALIKDFTVAPFGCDD